VSFRTNIPSPTIFPAPSRKDATELVRVLVVALNREFSAGLNPALCSERIMSKSPTDTKDCKNAPPQFVLVGASHMRRMLPHIVSQGFTVVDMTEKGWVLNARNIGSLKQKISGLKGTSDTVFVVDLLGNAGYRYKQEDDSLAMATRIGTGWHMLGDVVATPDSMLIEQVGLLASLISACPGQQKIILPPIPRYLFGGCCTNTEHATNTTSPDHGTNSLAQHSRQRKTLIKSLVDRGLKNFKVLDVIGSFCDTHTNTPNKLATLKPLFEHDNVHLTPQGYLTLSKNIISTATTLLTETQKITTPCTSPGTQSNRSWHGYHSTAGFGRISTRQLGGGGRGGGRNHPYFRKF